MDGNVFSKIKEKRDVYENNTTGDGVRGRRTREGERRFIIQGSDLRMEN